MKTRNFFIRFSIVFSFALWVVISLTYEGVSMAEEVQLVKILSVAKGGDPSLPTALMLAPQEVKIHKKGIVIWTNNAELSQVKVVFKEGKACQDVTLTPDKRFSLDQKACFVTTYMSYGGTSSLVFPEVGKLEYKVISEDGKLNAKGSINVIQ